MSKTTKPIYWLVLQYIPTKTHIQKYKNVIRLKGFIYNADPRILIEFLYVYILFVCHSVSMAYTLLSQK